MKNILFTLLIILSSFTLVARERSETNKGFKLGRVKLAAIFAWQKSGGDYDELDRDAQSPKLSWIPKLTLSQKWSMEGELGITPTQKYGADAVFILMNLNLYVNWYFAGGVGLYLTGGGQAWIDNGGYFGNMGGGLVFQYPKDMWLIDTLNVGYTAVLTPQMTTMLEVGLTFKFY